MMRNPFLLLRSILFIFLIYLNFLALGLAAWNITAARSASFDESGAPVFVLFNTILTIIYLFLALVALARPSFWSPKVVLECIWIGAFSCLGLAASIDITVSGPILACQGEVDMRTCASSTLLVIVSWISITLLMLYLLSLVCITSVHSTALADIWGAEVASVRWFEVFQRPQSSTSDKTLFYPKDPERQDSESSFYKLKDNESLYSDEPKSTWKPAGVIRPSLTAISISAPFSKSVESFRPQWAQGVKPRRGVDAPFLAPGSSQKSAAPRMKMKSHWSSTTASTYAPPVVPPKTRSPMGRQRSGNVVEVPSGMSLPVISPSPSRPISYGIFPEGVPDPDVPIKSCHRSKWIRADSGSR